MLVPTPFPGESLLCTRTGMQMEVTEVRGRKYANVPNSQSCFLTCLTVLALLRLGTRGVQLAPVRTSKLTYQTGLECLPR
jgi:hypothetical protein